jgi:hypothetical protein
MQKNIANTRFAACTASARLLIFSGDAARRATAGSCSTNFQFSTGGFFRSDFMPLSDNKNLNRHEIFRGKVSRRNNQKTKTKNSTSIERTHLRQTHE